MNRRDTRTSLEERLALVVDRLLAADATSPGRVGTTSPGPAPEEPAEDHSDLPPGPPAQDPEPEAMEAPERIESEGSDLRSEGSDLLRAGSEDRGAEGSDSDRSARRSAGSGDRSAGSHDRRFIPASDRLRAGIARSEGVVQQSEGIPPGDPASGDRPEDHHPAVGDVVSSPDGPPLPLVEGEHADDLDGLEDLQRYSVL